MFGTGKKDTYLLTSTVKSARLTSRNAGHRSHGNTNIKVVSCSSAQLFAYNPAWFHMPCTTICSPVSLFTPVSILNWLWNYGSLDTLDWHSPTAFVARFSAARLKFCRPLLPTQHHHKQSRAGTMFTLTLANTVVACIAIYFTFRTAKSWIRRRRFSRAHGCEAPTRIPQTERIVGFGLFRAMQADMKSRVLLPTALQWHREIGNTFSLVLLGQGAIVTIEPENIKAVLATQFHDFGIGTRYRGMGALLGHGIFSSDGSRWEQSRVGTFI